MFVTAFGRYATEAFDVLAVDYVLKPFSDERFAVAVGRAKTRVRERRLAELATQLATVSEELKPAAAPERPAFLSRLSFRQDDHSVIVNVADVIWIEAEDYYVLVHTRQGRHMVRATLASFEERLDPAAVRAGAPRGHRQRPRRPRGARRRRPAAGAVRRLAGARQPLAPPSGGAADAAQAGSMRRV